MRRPKFLRKTAPDRDESFPSNEEVNDEESKRQLESISLESNEIVHYVARQHRIFPGGSLLTPNTIYMTNKRIVIRAPMLFGFRTHFVDVGFDRIAAILLEEGVFTSSLSISLSGTVLIIKALPKNIARNIHDGANKYVRGESWGGNDPIVEKKEPNDIYK